MAARQLVLPGDIVKKSNAIIRARWPVESVWEPRIVALVASKVRAEDTDFQEYEIPISEFIGSKDDGRTYERLASAADNLLKKVITIEKGSGWAKSTIFSYCEYIPERGMLHICFDPHMKPHFLQLKERFTEYNLMEFFVLPSTYSQRIFEILKSWSDKSEIIISLQDLFDMLEVPESMKRYPDFRRFVLEKAHKDINKTSFYYEWEPVKQGRSVVAIKFIFDRKAIEYAERQKKNKDVPKRNKQFKLALACSQKKKAAGGCERRDHQKEVCDICSQLKIMEVTQ